MNNYTFSLRPFGIRGFSMITLALLIFGLICMSCGQPAVPINLPPPAEKPIIDDINTNEDTTESTNVINLSEEANIGQIGEAHFFNDSLVVLGEGFSFSKRVPYGRVLILFDEDYKIIKVETLQSLPFKYINKSTIYLLKGANLTMISRHTGIPIDQLMSCNPSIDNPNRIPALTRLKLNCSQ